MYLALPQKTNKSRIFTQLLPYYWRMQNNEKQKKNEVSIHLAFQDALTFSENATWTTRESFSRDILAPLGSFWVHFHSVVILNCLPLVKTRVRRERFKHNAQLACSSMSLYSWGVSSFFFARRMPSLPRGFPQRVVLIKWSRKNRARQAVNLA